MIRNGLMLIVSLSLLARLAAGFEIVVDDQVAYASDRRAAAASAGAASDIDGVWALWRSVCLRATGSAPQQDQNFDPIRGTLTIYGPVVLRASDGTSVRMDHLRLITCSPGDASGWKLHPAYYLLSFRVLEAAAAAAPAAAPEAAASAQHQPAARRPPEGPLVIAHRGASGYLPEHTQEAAALAWGLGADIIEQDVVLTRDGVPIVAHDIHLDTVTDVADRFPDRARPDGRWYAIDFDLNEIRTLRVNERVRWPSRRPAFLGRFPQQGRFHIATLAEMIELIDGLNRSGRRRVGIYPELKQPRWHREHGHDLTRTVLDVLDRAGYRSKRQHVYLQCFDADELRRLRSELRCELPLVQLIGDDRASDRMWTQEGLKEIVTYADGVGPPVNRVVQADSTGKVTYSPLVDVAHRLGLVVHAYTIRRDDLPSGFASDTQLFRECGIAGVDALFCDFPDRPALKP